MSRSAWQVLVMVVSGSLALRAQDEEKLVSGRVVDMKGRPVAGVTIGTMWSFHGEPQASNGAGRVEGDVPKAARIVLSGGGEQEMPDWFWGQGVKSDADGRFEGLFRIRWDAVTLLAYSADRRLSGSLRLDPEASGEDVTLTLRPSVRVRCSFTCEDLGLEVVEPILYLYLRAEPRRLLLGAGHGAEGRLDVLLPPGGYDMNLYGTDMDHIYRPVDVPADRSEIDLGQVDIPASFFALYRGKELPEWNVTAARGVPEGETSLASFRGKWLVVEFWGFW